MLNFCFGGGINFISFGNFVFLGGMLMIVVVMFFIWDKWVGLVMFFFMGGMVVVLMFMLFEICSNLVVLLFFLVVFVLLFSKSFWVVGLIVVLLFVVGVIIISDCMFSLFNGLFYNGYLDLGMEIWLEVWG